MWDGSSDRQYHFNRVALIGTGLIGGSIGLALTGKKLAQSVVCYDRDPAASAEAVALGAADTSAASASEAATGADLVVLAVPVLSTLKILEDILPAVSEGAIITDVGSTKGSTMAAVEQMLKTGVYYVGGHPMAGSEEIGIRGADPALLENAIYVLAPASETPEAVVEKLSALIRAIGAQPINLDPLSHDRIVALVSHLPHVIAATLVRSVAAGGDPELVRTLAAGGFRDSTRIVLGNPEIWRDICVSNRWPLISALKGFRSSLDALEQYLNEPNPEAIEEYLLQARDYRGSIPYRGRGILPELHELIVLVKDTPGMLAKVTGLLGDAGINIDAIEILHVRELAGGSVKIGFKDSKDHNRALQLLSEEGFQVHSR